jgi:hypothetical protein
MDGGEKAGLSRSPPSRGVTGEEAAPRRELWSESLAELTLAGEFVRLGDVGGGGSIDPCPSKADSLCAGVGDRGGVWSGGGTTFNEASSPIVRPGGEGEVGAGNV